MSAPTPAPSISWDQMELFPDLAIEPTIAMERGEAFLAQCGWCGLLVCVPGPGIDGVHRGATRAAQLGTCPSCRHDDGWWPEPFPNGPFRLVASS